MNEKFNAPPKKQEGGEDQKPEQNPILNRVVEEAGVPDLLSRLTEIPNTDFQSLLLEIMEKKSLKTGVREINSTIENNPFVKLSKVDQLTFVKFDGLAYSLLPSKYKGIELSPVVPFATNKVLADISQKRVLSTARNSEVISDPTTALALYCAKERIQKIKKNPADPELVALASSQRVIRQDQIKKEGYSQHFRTFTLSVAGRDVGFEKFEKDNLKEHLTFFLSLLKELNESGSYAIEDITVTIANVEERQSDLLDRIKDSVVKELVEEYPNVTFNFDPNRKSNYYKSLCYSISARNKEQKEPISVAGGGMTDWTEKLVGSKKERLLVGSIGSETLCKHFGV